MKPYGSLPPTREPAKPPIRSDKPVLVNKKRARQEGKKWVEIHVPEPLTSTM